MASWQAAPAHQGHAEIELRIRGPIRRAFPIAERGDGVVVAPLAHHELRQQHVSFCVDARIDLVGNLAQCALRFLQITALIPNLAEIKPGPVAHEFGGVLFQQGLEYPARLDMLAQGKIQAAEQQFGLLRGVRNPAQLPRRQQAGDRIKIVVLKEVEQHIAVGKILDFMRRQPIGIRLDVLGLQRPRRRQQQSAEHQRPQCVDQAQEPVRIFRVSRVGSARERMQGARRRPWRSPTAKPRNTADAPLAANPVGPGRFRFRLCCRLLIGNKPNRVGSASPEAKSATVAATRNIRTGSTHIIPSL